MAVDQLVNFILNIVIDFAIFAIIALSLNLEVGYAGIPNFGRVLTVAGGAFVVGFLPGRLALYVYGVGYDYVAENAHAVDAIRQNLEGDVAFAALLLVLTLVTAAVVGALLGYLVSRPAIRLREDYLAITLLILGDTLVIIGVNYPPLVGGTLGVHIPPIYEVLFGGGFNRYVYSTLFTAAIAALIFYYIYRVTRSPLGRVLKAMRDNETAIRAYGRDIVSLRTKVLIIGGAISAIAGALYALYVGSVHARTYDKVVWTFYPWLMMLLGGLANNLGTLLGVFAFVVTRQLIIYFRYDIAAFIPFDPVWLEYILFGSVLIAILMVRPQGLLPEKAEPVLKRDVVRRIIEQEASR